MLPTAGPVESLIVRLPGTSTSCASAVRIGRSIESAAENRNVRVLIFLKLILDSLPKKLDERSIWSSAVREPIAPPLVKVVASAQPLVIHELKDAAVTHIRPRG